MPASYHHHCFIISPQGSLVRMHGVIKQLKRSGAVCIGGRSPYDDNSDEDDDDDGDDGDDEYNNHGNDDE